MNQDTEFIETQIGCLWFAVICLTIAVLVIGAIVIAYE